jgi:hypothetical protein
MSIISNASRKSAILKRIFDGHGFSPLGF